MTAAMFVVAALAVLRFYEPPETLLQSRFGTPTRPLVPPASASSAAFGRSGAVQIRFALPNDVVEFPLAVHGDPTALEYGWVRVTDSAGVDSIRALTGDTLRAPTVPGFYRLALLRGRERRILDDVTLAVMVPFEEKRGGILNGYRIGTFRAERRGARQQRPDGFVQVVPELVNLAVTQHLRLGSFVAPDGQTTWPRYAALDRRLLDKLELVFQQLSRWRSDTAAVQLTVSVNSGFRTPWYNRRVPRAARDSRHQLGDAADVVIDANGDGRITRDDANLVAEAVEVVERSHPDLAGGLGIYVSPRYRQPYVHIDTRGKRVRWRG
ncbi:MAG: D-Ala-D-Ala carboxypeptidase family metallohydrolase [Gemmatimonadaceae bacterium]